MLRIVTWNLDGLDDRHLDLRTEAACFHLLLRDDPADVVLLQEVVRRSFFAHLKPHFRRAGFGWAAEPGFAESGYFPMIFARAPLRIRSAQWLPFPDSCMGRGLMTARLEGGGASLRVGTAHLESLREGGPERIRQAARVLGWLGAEPGPAIFGGDTNLRDAEWGRLPAELRAGDAWQLAGAPEAHRHTWDPARTGRMSQRARGAPRLRFDRVWLSPGWRVQALRLSGAQVVPGTGGLTPSDHLALWASLEPPAR